jgi:hypothetical protein
MRVAEGNVGSCRSVVERVNASARIWVSGYGPQAQARKWAQEVSRRWTTRETRWSVLLGGASSLFFNGRIYIGLLRPTPPRTRG